jgi:hypothetical protein
MLESSEFRRNMWLFERNFTRVSHPERISGIKLHHSARIMREISTRLIFSDKSQKQNVVGGSGHTSVDNKKGTV